MRAVNIIALVLVFILIFVAGYYVDVVHTARWSFLFGDYGYGGYGSSYNGDADSLTMQAAGIMLLFLLFYTFAYIGNLIKVKTITSKVMTIIGLSFTFLMFLAVLLSFVDPGGASFDESGPVFIVYGVINLAFFIVLLVQSVNFHNRRNGNVSSDTSAEIIDMEIE